MAGSAGRSIVGRSAVHIAVLAFVILWTIPTLGILVSSLRDKDQIIASGWWSSFASSSQTEAGRLPASSQQVQKGDKYVIEGNLFGDGPAREISAFGTKSANPTEFNAGDVANLNDGVTLHRSRSRASAASAFTTPRRRRRNSRQRTTRTCCSPRVSAAPS